MPPVPPGSHVYVCFLSKLIKDSFKTYYIEVLYEGTISQKISLNVLKSCFYFAGTYFTYIE